MDRVWLEHAFPSDHALGGNAVPDGLEVVNKVGTVNPISIRKVRTDKAAPICGVTGRAEFYKVLTTFREH
ncbi:hypothetical protein SDC9_210088 [bioreactor metagenome]|uniref:Uncharacterized protein n=1 Tax=bioreactor metagenome TaxID=1076179 RepID=A0A645JFG1_9ZZZZ